ncbi:MAG: cupin domain-containing protein [Pseudorhodobacter sp.]
MTEGRAQAVGTLLVETDRVKVWRYEFAPGAETGWHRHGHDYVICAVTDCAMRLELPGGEVSEVLVPAGSAYARAEGVEHNVINAGIVPMCFIETELK